MSLNYESLQRTQTHTLCIIYIYVYILHLCTMNSRHQCTHPNANPVPSSMMAFTPGTCHGQIITLTWHQQSHALVMLGPAHWCTLWVCIATVGTMWRKLLGLFLINKTTLWNLSSFHLFPLALICFTIEAQARSLPAFHKIGQLYSVVGALRLQTLGLQVDPQSGLREVVVHEM